MWNDIPHCGAKIKARSRNIPSSVRREVWKRDNGVCVKCGNKNDLEFDHIIPFSKGGSNTAKNIQLLCSRCNREKYDKI
ncbi:MAG: HNH endonuclease [Candidatus Lokiarchaeota archaeon]